MAEEIHFQGAEVKLRNPWAVWALGIVTLSVYHLVWWYKLNREMRDYSAAAGRPLDNDPTASVLALFPGSLIIVPAFWTIVTTCQRMRKVREMVDGRPEGTPNGLLAVLLSLLWSLNSVYMGYAANEMWRRARERQGQDGLPAEVALPAATPA